MNNNNIYNGILHDKTKKMGIKIFMMVVLMLIVIPSVLGEVEYFQVKSDLGNGTIRNYIFFEYNNGFGLGNNYVTGNNAYEVNLLYNLYPKSWNLANTNSKVNYCELKINTFVKHQNSTPMTVLDINYTDLDEDISNVQYFFKLYDGDRFEAYENCYFQNLNYSELEIPAEMQIVTPTWECKACQYYQWSVQEASVIKANSIGNNVVTISDYIKKFFMLNFEIWLAFFWFSLIMVLFISVGTLFLTFYWFYKFLAKRI